MIRMEKLTKHFKQVTAVDSISIRVASGEIYGFLGPNGAGKTTTIKMLAGIMRPTSGRIFIDGLELEKHPLEVKSRVGFIPDRPFLYDKLTGAEFMSFMANQKDPAVPRTLRTGRVGRRISGQLFPWDETAIDHERCSPPPAPGIHSG